jgi:hypothetical protein
MLGYLITVRVICERCCSIQFHQTFQNLALIFACGDQLWVGFEPYQLIRLEVVYIVTF